MVGYVRLIAVMLCGGSQTLCGQPAPASAPATNSFAAVQARLGEAVAQPRLAAAALGVKVVSAETGKVLFEHNAGKLLKPASNAKLYTGSMALDRLGPDYRIKTSFYAAEKPDANGVVNGDLIVYGRGDFSLAARFNDGDHKKALAQIVSVLTNAGIRQITGDLVGDESYFHGPPMGSGWTWDDLQFYYGAEVSALTLEDNVVDLVVKPGTTAGAPCQITCSPANTYLTLSNRTVTVEKEGGRGIELYRPVGENVVYVSGKMPLGNPGHTDAVAVHNPARWYVTLLRDALAAQGIKVGGGVRSVNWLDRESMPLDTGKLVEVAKLESRPLSEMLGKMLKPSQNLYAQLLLLQVGAQRPAKPAAQSTEDAGIAELGKFLGEAGIKKGEVLLEEGSGLSRSALLAPNATVTLLQYMSRHRFAAIFRDALPVGGVDGTLRTRFGGTAAANNVHAKTGTLRYVNAISGYVTTAAKEPLVFSIMLNNYNAGDARYSGRAEVDALVLMLAGMTSRSGDGR